MLLGGTSLLLKLFKTLLVFSSFLAGVFKRSLLLSKTSTLVAESSVGDKTLDLGSLISLVTVVFELAANNELGDVVLLGETEELADVGSSLGSKTAGNSSSLVGQSGNILLTLLDNHQVEDADISTNNAATDRLALAFTLSINVCNYKYITASSVARHTVSEEEADTVVAENTLLHGETLLIVSTSDATKSTLLLKNIPEDVTLEFLTEGITFNFLGDSLIHENTAMRSTNPTKILQLVFIIDVNRHLRTESGIANVKLKDVNYRKFKT